MRTFALLLMAASAAAAAAVAPGGSSAACATSDEVAAFQAATPAARAAYARTHRRSKDRSAWDARRRARLDALARSALSCASGTQLLSFFPQGGVVGRDLYLTNTVDLQAGDGILDPWCGSRTYDGHTGEDVVIRSFREQAIGVPVFAALDGRVKSVQEGMKDTSYGTQTLPWDNHVIVDAGHGQLQVYGHLRRGSVTVREGEWVVAGPPDRPHGLERQLRMAAPALHDDARLPADGSVGRRVPPGRERLERREARRRRPLRPRLHVLRKRLCAGTTTSPWDDATRTGTFAAGRRTLQFRVELGNADAVSRVSVRIRRPDGTVALADEGAATFRRWRQTWGTWAYPVDLGRDGPLDADRRVRRRHARRRALRRRRGRSARSSTAAPAPVTATLTRTASGARVCTVAQDLVHEDPDYDIVRYRYVWRAGGTAVRAVTSAGLVDVLPRTAPRDATCSVTPSDGRLTAATTTAG